MKPELSIVIVNWNGMNFLPGCLESIAKHPPEVLYEVITIDNASTDGSADWLDSDHARAMFPQGSFKFIRSDENLGFGRANNLAFEQTSSPFVFLLNPDTIVTNGAIDQLMVTLRSNKTFGAAAPKLLNEDGSLQPSVWGFPPSPLSIIVDGLKIDSILPKVLISRWLYADHWDYDTLETVPLVAAAALLVKREMLTHIGGFDPSFDMYGEDMEWCGRMKRNGWKIAFDPISEVKHLGGQSSKQRWTETEHGLVQVESFILFQNRCLSSLRSLLNSSSYVLVLGLHGINRRIRKRDATVIYRQVKMHLSNCRNIVSRWFGVER